MFSQGTYYTFGKKTFTISLVKRLPLFVLCFIAIIFLSLVFRSMTGNILLFGAIVLLIYFISLLSSSWYRYKSHQFMLDEFSLHIRRGIMNREETAIPYRQIQDVNLKESYVERLFGVAELSVFTAGHEATTAESAGESKAIFPLIDHGYALELQQELLKRSNVQEVVGHTPGGNASSIKPTQ